MDLPQESPESAAHRLCWGTWTRASLAIGDSKWLATSLGSHYLGEI